MKKLPITILILVALSLAGISAYLSIFGLSKLFIGASLIVIIAMSILESSKIVIVTLLNQFWNKFPRLLRYYFLLSMFGLMLLTGIGVYGFLSSAYTATSIRVQKNTGTIELLKKKDTLFKQEKLRYENIIKTKTDRAKTLSELNLKQETRIDSMYNRNQYYNANRVENAVTQTTNNIKIINDDIDKTNEKIRSLDDSISKYDMQILEVTNNDVATDLGPLKYVAESLGIKMDTLVRYLLLILIFLFDPLAVAFVLAINIIIKLKNKPKDEVQKIEEKIQEETENKEHIKHFFEGKWLYKPKKKL